MVKAPYISVVVPMYKVERYIKVCIDSILAQTFQDFEIIIIDNASPDNCYDICKNLYEGKYGDKVRIIRHSDNRELGGARNTGIKNARGKYIYFVDSDDAISSNALEKLHDAAERTDADVIHVAGWYETNQDDDKPFVPQNFRLIREQHEHEGWIKYDVPYRLRECFDSYKCWPMAWLNMCKREFLENNNLKFLDTISEDETFSFALYCLAKKFYILRDAFYVYRRRESSIMKTYNPWRFSEGLRAVLTGSRYVKELMDSVPELAYNRTEQEKFITVLVERHLNNHVLPFYNGGNLPLDLDEKVFETFLPVFKEDTALIKYFFHLSNIYRKRLMIAIQQNQQLVAQLQRTQLLISAGQLKVSPNKIVFINFLGRGYGCNPKYIAEEIMRQNLPYDLVWLVENLNMPMPQKIRKVIFNSAESIRELSTAKIIVTNVKNALPFIKKPNQYMIVTWHGDGALKYVGKDAEHQLSPNYVAESKANSAITDLMLSGSQQQFENMRDGFWYSGEIAKFGSPRNDIFFNATDEFKSKIRASLNIPANKKIIIYAPTFRDNIMRAPTISDNNSAILDVYKLDYDKLLDVMKKKFGGEWTVLVRFHPNISRMNFASALFKPSANIIDVTQYPDMQELIVISDVLVSDYSSVIYDFSISHKPVFIFAKDVDTYPKERGLRPIYFEIPYKINKTEDELFKCIETFNFDSTEVRDKFDKYLKYYNSYDDGHASERVVERIKAVIDGTFQR